MSATAAAISRENTPDIYRYMEAGEIHCLETPDGLLLVCAESLGAA